MDIRDENLAGETTGPSLAEQLMAHATEHYEDGGWDVIVECWSLDETAENIAGATTLEEAIAKVQLVVDVWSERQADARNSAF